jgi:hypothetical protein
MYISLEYFLFFSLFETRHRVLARYIKF